MHNVLEQILGDTKRELEERKKGPVLSVDNTKLKKSSFKENILDPVKGDIALIAEIKLKSPMISDLGSKEDILGNAKEYEQFGADAISIITEKNHFDGELKYVTQTKENVSLPVLQKDFVIDSFQIEESRALGADALLLIARIIPNDDLINFVNLCKEIGIEPVVEISSKEDLDKALKTETEIIAVNARDLDTFEVSIDKACKLLNEIPSNFIKIGFSGVKSRKEVEKYRIAGAHAVLVGTELMRSDNIEEFIKELKNAS
jgi:indole-3-glycerol phosphate synthase